MQSVSGANGTMATRRPMWLTAARALLGLLPLWILLYELTAIRGWGQFLGTNPPAIAGLPTGSC
jgi:hypothetical protein